MCGHRVPAHACPLKEWFRERELCPELISLPPNWVGIPGPQIQTYRSASDKLLLATSMVSVIYWAMPDGSCNKTYLHSLPGHVGEHTRRHRLIKEGGEQVSSKGCYGTLVSCPHHPYPLVLALTSKASVCQQRIFQGSYCGEKGGEFQGCCHGDALCVYRAEA